MIIKENSKRVKVEYILLFKINIHVKINWVIDMKLNKKGWALDIEIFYIGVFVLCLIIAIFGIIKLNLLLGRDKNKNFNYETLETKLVNASKEYIDDKDKISENEIITSSELISKNYLDELKDEDNTDCTGYVEVEVSDEMEYKAYITCFDYTTKGYRASKEQK